MQLPAVVSARTSIVVVILVALAIYFLDLSILTRASVTQNERHGSACKCGNDEGGVDSQIAEIISDTSNNTEIEMKGPRPLLRPSTFDETALRTGYSANNISGHTGFKNATDVTNTAMADDKYDCLTYEERFGRCREIRRMELSEQRKIFHGASTGDASEAAILRIANIEWPEDFWLNVCAFVVETSEGGGRIPILLTNKPQVRNVPWEFQSLVRVQDDEIMNRLMTQPIYDSGYWHGDQLAALWLLLERPGLDFVWAFDNDVRYSGHYGRMLTESRKWAADNPGINATLMPAGTEAHVIVFSKPITDPKWFHAGDKTFFHGEYQNLFRSPNFFGLFMPVFGLSRFLSMKLIEQNLLGNSHRNLEANVPATVLHLYNKTNAFAKISSVPINSAVYFTIYRKNIPRMYKPWREGSTFTEEAFMPSTPPNEQVLTPHPLGEKFVGQNCLANYLMHPVKV